MKYNFPDKKQKIGKYRKKSRTKGRTALQDDQPAKSQSTLLGIEITETV